MHLNISVFEQTLPSTLKFNYNIGGHTTEVPNGIIKVPLLAERGNAALLLLVNHHSPAENGVSRQQVLFQAT